MTWQMTLILFFATLLVMLLSGMTLPAVFMTVSGVGAYIFWGGFDGLEQMALTLCNAVKSWSLLPIPLFVLMGEILFQTGIMSKALDVVDMWLGKLPGRLSIVGVLSSLLMGTFTGSSMASCSMLCTTLVPEMEKRGYNPVMTVGVIGGTGGLAMMVPPSSLAVTVATIAGASVSKMLVGAIMPGVLMGIGYISYIVIRAIVRPQDAPSYDVEKPPLRERLVFTLKNIVPILIIIVSVSGVILMGLATPTEAAACGVVVSIIVPAIQKTLTFEKLKNALLRSTKTSAMLLSILLGASMFSSILSFSGATKNLTNAVVNLPVPPHLIVFLFLAVVFGLGCFMETNSIMMITLPIFVPMVQALGFSEIWFLLLMMMCCETAEATPPFGVSLFVIKGLLPKLEMKTIINANIPFIISDIVVTTLVFLFPALVMWLPNMITLR